MDSIQGHLRNLGPRIFFSIINISNLSLEFNFGRLLNIANADERAVHSDHIRILQFVSALSPI
jgi:hypothetical protein